MQLPHTRPTADAGNISVRRALIPWLAMTVLLLATTITPAARAQEFDSQMGRVVVVAGGRPPRDQIEPLAERERRVKPGALRSVTIPSGTTVEVLLGQELSTRTDRVGNLFSISLAKSIVIDAETVLAEGTSLLGQIVDLTPAWQGAGRMTLVLDRLLVEQAGVAIPMKSEALTFERKRRLKDHAIVGSICAASVAAALILGRKPSGSGEGFGGYLALGGCALGGVAYEHFRTKDVVLPPKKKLVFRLIGDVIVSLPVMQGLFRQGAFQGPPPTQAYFVECDNETTTQDDISFGVVTTSRTGSSLPVNSVSAVAAYSSRFRKPEIRIAASRFRPAASREMSWAVLAC